jgi:predicted HNH restriction endonuclease
MRIDLQAIRSVRSPRNLKEAIRIHGKKCRCCGFDFELVYESDLAGSYIEIHHIKSIIKTEGIVNPSTDLMPLCSNCHIHGPLETWRDHAGRGASEDDASGGTPARPG